jgi:lauroyl/myristoyl acyltransferase
VRLPWQSRASRSSTWQDDPLHRARLPVRIYASKWTHRLLPARVALPLAATLGPFVRQRRNPAERRDAERFMHDLLLYTPRYGEARELAQSWVTEKARVHELFWRPWLLKHSRVLGVEHWHAAHAGGRSAIIVFGHFVGSWTVPAILGLNGFDHSIVISSTHFYQPIPPSYPRLVIEQTRREYLERPLGESHLISSDAPPERVLDLVESGSSVAIAFDVNGTSPTPFLGRTVFLTGGPATLAFRTGAKLLPAIAERRGTRIDLRLLEPIDPTSYRNIRSLRTAVVRIFEPIVLARPEMVEMVGFPSPLVSEMPLAEVWRADDEAAVRAPGRAP